MPNITIKNNEVSNYSTAAKQLPYILNHDTLICGAPGSGKSDFIYSQLSMTDSSFLIADFESQTYKKTNELLAAKGYNIIQLSEDQREYSYNPLNYLYESYGAFSQMKTMKFIHILIENSSYKKIADDLIEINATNLFVLKTMLSNYLEFCITYMFETSLREERTISKLADYLKIENIKISNIQNMLSDVEVIKPKSRCFVLYQMIKEMFHSPLFELQNIVLDNISHLLINAFKNVSNQKKALDFRNMQIYKTALYIPYNIQENIEENQVIYNIVSPEYKKRTLKINQEPSQKLLLAIIYNQCFDILCEQEITDDTLMTTLIMNNMIDIGNISSLETMIHKSDYYKINFILIAQTINQILTFDPKDSKVIIDLCTNILSFGGDQDTKNFINETSGQYLTLLTK